MVFGNRTQFALYDRKTDWAPKSLSSGDERLPLFPAVLVIAFLNVTLWADIVALLVWLI